jgi:hypothetical protein
MQGCELPPEMRTKVDKKKKKANVLRIGDVMRTKIIGKGDYTIGQQLRGIAKGAIINGGRAIGSYAGGQFGMSRDGARIGGKLGERFSHWIGSGDYEMSNRTNSLIRSAHSVPANSSFEDPSKGVPIVHREYIGELYSSPNAGTFNVTTLSGQPGLGASFPWLSQLAILYEYYTIESMIYEYESSVSNYQAAGGLGTLMLSCEYNVSSTPFSNKVNLMNSDFAEDCRVDKNMLYGIECNRWTRSEYATRNTTSTLPLIDTDAYNLQIATLQPATFPTSSVLGSLFCTYRVRFYKPRIGSVAPPANYIHLSGNGAVGGTSIVTTPAVQYGAGTYTNTAVVTTNTIAFTATAGDVFIVNVCLRTTTTFTSSGLMISSVTGATASNVFAQHTQNGCVSGYTGAGAGEQATSYMAPSTGTVTVVFNNIPATTGSVGIDVFITYLANGTGNF